MLRPGCVLSTNASMTEVETHDDIMDLAAKVAIVISVGVILVFLTATAHIAVFSLVGERQARRVRMLAFRNVLRQDIGYFDKHMGGDLNTRLAE